jgi:hypothetical protein
MLKRTYIHLPGVGPRSEAYFWRLGLHYWEDFLGVSRVRGFAPERLARLKADLTECLARVDNPGYFVTRLAPGEHWRLWRTFRPRAVYLDIETTGLYWPGLQVTVVGLYDGAVMRQFVHGHNLQEFPAAIRDFDLVVTYNGTQFDLPVLRACFPGLRLPPVHVDLRFLLARLGYRGGLKGIEPHFGLHRPEEVEGMDGYMAVVLWERFQRGDRGALELLLTYNREDVINLEYLMERAFEMHRARLLGTER